MKDHRPLQPWEIAHTNRHHIYKLPLGTIPSKTLPEPDFHDEDDSASDSDSCDGRDPLTHRHRHTARLLAKRYYDICAAHNDRSFSPTAHPWCLAMPGARIQTAFGPDGTGAARDLGVGEYLGLVTEMFGEKRAEDDQREGGGASVEVRDVTVQMDGKGMGRALVFVNQVLRMRGVVRGCVCVVEFRWVGGQWLLAGMRYVKGLDYGSY